VKPQQLSLEIPMLVPVIGVLAAELLRDFMDADIDDCRRSCEKLRDDVTAYVAIELPEPTEGDVALVRVLIEKVAEG
jgi:hypothetical protein